jgi:hypothetical protein
VIQYSLQCSQGHRFDGWFRNAEAFDQQQARGIVACVVCGDATVEKAIMAPALARTDNSSSASSSPPTPAQIRDWLRAYRRKVMSEADYVGTRFAEEARKIHFEEAEERGIYGEASREEIVGLLEDGVEVLPLPDLPEEHN